MNSARAAAFTGPERPGRHLTLPASVLLLGLALTALVTWQLFRVSEARDQERFDRLAEQRLDSIEDRLEAHIGLLRGAAGLFAASDEVTREDMRAYVARLRLGELYPGVQGVGFARRFEPGERGAVARFMREQGYGDVALRPDGDRAEPTAIVFLEPLDRRNRAALGFDMFTEPTRRAAMERARDTGRSALSGRVELVQEIDADKQPGFLIYTPVYDGGRIPGTVEERRARLLGWAYSPFRAGDLFREAIDPERSSPELDYAVYDGARPDPSALLYSSREGSGTPPDGGTVRTLDIAGRTWSVALQPTPAFEAGSNRSLLPYVFAAGLLATLILSAGVWAQARATRRAEAARAALQEETRRLDALNRASTTLSAELDLDRLVEAAVAEAVVLTGAAYGAFFERKPGAAGAPDAWRLFSLAGAPAEAFTRFGLPRATALFGPTFRAEGVVRSEDVLSDARYGSLGGMPEGHLPVRSYLAAPVTSRSGETLGALLFGHPEPGRFGRREEDLVVGFAGQAAVALDNARLFGAAQEEIARRQDAEQALRKLNDTLEARVAERTAELERARAALEAVNADLEGRVVARVSDVQAANAEIQRFAYIVSHDLRAPLVNIMGFTSELDGVLAQVRSELPPGPKADEIEGEFTEALGFIKAAITKMDGLIGAILKLSREGRRTFAPEPLDMRGLVQGLADAQRHQIDAAGALVEIGDLPDVEADRLATEQVFGNLLDNAIKYLDAARPGRVVVSGRVEGNEARFEVRDNGRGVAAQDQQRVFDLFRRAGTQDKPGEGIGLAHVRTLVRAMGGRIELSSELGAGSTFAVVLPITPPEPERRAQQQAA